MEKDPQRWLEVLRRSQTKVAALSGKLSGGQLRQQSYCDEWSVAQVLSHLGSGAEIFSMILNAARSGTEPPDHAGFQLVWDRWNAKSPDQQRDDFLVADAALLEALESLGNTLDAVPVRAMGREMDMSEFLAMRLGEHALHAWDVAVTFEPKQTLDQAAADLLIDRVPRLAGALGHPVHGEDSSPLTIRVVTSDLDRSFLFEIGTTVTVADLGRDRDHADLRLSSEALIRLVNGRLDAAHTPPDLVAPGPDPAETLLDTLRAAFPGF